MKKIFSFFALLIIALFVAPQINADTLLEKKSSNGGEVYLYKDMGAYIANSNDWTGQDYMDGAVAIEIEILGTEYRPSKDRKYTEIINNAVIAKGTYVVGPGLAEYFLKKSYPTITDWRIVKFVVKPYKVTPEQKRRLTHNKGGSFKL